MDPAIQALVDAQQLDSAGLLAEQRGQPALAIELFERACAFDRASKIALATGDAKRAAAFALRAGDEGLFKQALASLETSDCAKVAADAERARFFTGAASAYERAEAWAAAAGAWESARNWGEAARCYERVEGGALAAAKALETGLRHEPARADWLLLLSRMLVSHGKFENAMKYLQRIPHDANEYVESVKLIYHVTKALGLVHASHEAEATLRKLSPEFLENVAPPSSRVAELLFGRYELIAQWATTPTARILRCRDRTSGQEVALKWFRPLGLSADGRGAAARFEREIRTLESLRHPHIVQLIDYHDSGPVMVLPWMAGGTLGDLIERGPIAPSRAVEIATALLDALGEAHRLGIVHRDLKPSNVLFDDVGTPHLADFGVAHMGDASITMTAAIIGTVGFMSPEQRSGMPASPKSDLYGVGALLVAMLTGEQEDIARAPAASACHRNLTHAHDALLTTLLAASPRERPDDAYAAKSMLLTVEWPSLLEVARGPRELPNRNVAPNSARDRLSAGNVDTFTGTLVDAVPLSPDVLACARTFAQVRDRMFQAVLRVDSARNELWLEKRTTIQVEAITHQERSLIVEALDDLWTRSHAHGQLAQGLYRDVNGHLRIAFSGSANGTKKGDLDALESIMTKPPA